MVGTGPFFGEKTFLADKRPAENMDLSPSFGRRPCVAIIGAADMNELSVVVTV
jgi:hypothetical protein